MSQQQYTKYHHSLYRHDYLFPYILTYSHLGPFVRLVTLLDYYCYKLSNGRISYQRPIPYNLHLLVSQLSVSRRCCCSLELHFLFCQPSVGCWLRRSEHVGDVQCCAAASVVLTSYTGIASRVRKKGER